jgi:hypothetical protein
MAGDLDPIVFDASVYKVQTLADGGIRVTLDLPETATLEAAHLMVCQANGVVLQASLTPIEAKPQNGGTRTIGRTKAKRRIGRSADSV